MHRSRTRRGLLSFGLALAVPPIVVSAQATDTPVRLVMALYQRYAWEVSGAVTGEWGGDSALIAPIWLFR